MNNEDDRQIITTNIGYIEIESCSVEELINVLQKFQNNYEGHIVLSPEGGYSGFNGYSVILTRDETDSEMAERHAAEAKQAAMREGKEMKLLLKKKTLNDAEKARLIKYIQENM